MVGPLWIPPPCIQVVPVVTWRQHYRGAPDRLADWHIRYISLGKPEKGTGLELLSSDNSWCRLSVESMILRSQGPKKTGHLPILAIPVDESYHLEVLGCYIVLFTCERSYAYNIRVINVADLKFNLCGHLAATRHFQHVPILLAITLLLTIATISFSIDLLSGYS